MRLMSCLLFLGLVGCTSIPKVEVGDCVQLTVLDRQMFKIIEKKNNNEWIIECIKPFKGTFCSSAYAIPQRSWKHFNRINCNN